MSNQEDFFGLDPKIADLFKSMGDNLQIPCNSMITQGVTYSFDEFGKDLSGTFSFDERFTNPLQTYQGGFLCAAIDNVFGPLSYLAALKPVLTIQLNTTFIRPFTAKDQQMIVKAQVVSISKTLLVMNAEVKTVEGKLLANSNSQSIIVNS